VREQTFVHDAPVDGHAVLVQTRAHAEPVLATMHASVVRFEQPQPRVAPGQTIAFYDASDTDLLIGGAIAV